MVLDFYYPFIIIWVFVVMVVYPILKRKRGRYGMFDPMQLALIAAPLLFYFIITSGIIGPGLTLVEDVGAPTEVVPEGHGITMPVEDLPLNYNITQKINSTEPVTIKKEENAMYDLKETEFDFSEITI
jgi:hypothetical protein